MINPHYIECVMIKIFFFLQFPNKPIENLPNQYST